MDSNRNSSMRRISWRLKSSMGADALKTHSVPIRHRSFHSSSLVIHVSSISSSLPAINPIPTSIHMSSNLSTTTSLGLKSRKRKRRKLNNNNQIDHNPKTTSTWISESDLRIYFTKLIAALRQASSTPAADPRNIRIAADRVLAVTAKGRTRWSLAILKNHRRRLHLRSKILKKVSKKIPDGKLAIGSGGSRIGESSQRQEKVPEVEKRVRVLGQLVPGCCKLSFPSLLEETTDYIAALEMQVKAMAILAQLLSNSAPSLTSGS